LFVGFQYLEYIFFEWGRYFSRIYHALVCRVVSTKLDKF